MLHTQGNVERIKAIISTVFNKYCRHCKDNTFVIWPNGNFNIHLTSLIRGFTSYSLSNSRQVNFLLGGRIANLKCSVFRCRQIRKSVYELGIVNCSVGRTKAREMTKEQICWCCFSRVSWRSFSFWCHCYQTFGNPSAEASWGINIGFCLHNFLSTRCSGPQDNWVEWIEKPKKKIYLYVRNDPK